MLDIGEEAPDFELADQDGACFTLSQLRGKRNVVLFFYPKDNTLFCTLEVCAFRDAHMELLAQEADVLGISGDPAGSHKQVVERWRLPYRLLSDAEGAVRKAYEVGKTLGLFPGRVTYVIDKEGRIRGAINDPLRAKQHAQEALKMLNAQRIV
ncbi:MAG TPA: peroxiredoxin [Flavobacteriales bacterium]|nr:peroxiredoxin [Flavobacteriales bacterium]